MLPTQVRYIRPIVLSWKDGKSGGGKYVIYTNEIENAPVLTYLPTPSTPFFPPPRHVENRHPALPLLPANCIITHNRMDDKGISSVFPMRVTLSMEKKKKRKKERKKKRRSEEKRERKGKKGGISLSPLASCDK